MTWLYLFPSTHDALVAEKRWEKANYPGKLRPIPRVLSSSCGLCLEAELPLGADPIQIATELGFEWELIVQVQGKEYIEKYRQD